MNTSRRKFILTGAAGLAPAQEPQQQLTASQVVDRIKSNIGIPWRDCHIIGNLLGTRTIINEFLAFSELGKLKATLDPRTFSIATFALCGFANVGSIGMQIGGIGALVPNRRNDLARLGLRAMLAGTMANFMSASIVSMLIK